MAVIMVWLCNIIGLLQHKSLLLSTKIEPRSNIFMKLIDMHVQLISAGEPLATILAGVVEDAGEVDALYVILHVSLLTGQFLANLTLKLGATGQH